MDINKLVLESLQNTDPYEILNRLKEKYKGKIPIFTDKVVFKKGVIPHSHPIITLNYRWMFSKNPEATLLMLFIHEQLHWYAEKTFTKNTFDQLWNDYIFVYDNDEQLSKSIYNKWSFIEHLVVITNELNIAHNILTQQEYNDVYNCPRVYSLMENYISSNFKEIYSDLLKRKMIWS